ncbi:MAG: nickel insertion protein, partial [Pseudoflavonifractor sp.]
MRLLYLECNMGAAGDMLMAALYGLLPDQEGFLAKMNGLGLPGVAVAARSASTCGIAGIHMAVTVDGCEESDHEHEHAHEHSHEHAHEHS